MAKAHQVKEHIISALSLDYLPETERGAILEKMVDVVQGRVLLRILQELTGKEKKEFTRIMDYGTDKELQTFLEAAVPGLLAIIDEETTTLKSEMLEQVGVRSK